MQRLLTVVASFVLLVGCSHPIPAYESHYTPPPSETATVWPPFDGATIRAALRSAEPYTIAVLGDSTGNEVIEWVHLVSQRIAAIYGRPVTIHDWDTDANAYKPATTTYPGPGAPVTIWNGSASGKAAQFSVDNFAALDPVPVNLAIISHSHNGPTQTAEWVDRLIYRAHGNLLPGGSIVVTLQNPRLDDASTAQQAAVDQLRRAYSAPGSAVGVVDVNAAFKNIGDLATLLRPDHAHPNNAGQQLWADTVWDALFA